MVCFTLMFHTNALFFLGFGILVIGCKDEPEPVSLPVVETRIVTDITSTTAVSGGEVLYDGGSSIIEKGVCWDVLPLPKATLTTRIIAGQDTGLFLCTLTDLYPGRQYYIRAYATNITGTSYGQEFSFIAQNTVVYKTDGRQVRITDALPITLDLTSDGYVDFTIFLELTANSQGDRLYAGVNPIGVNWIKSGPFIDDNFLNMGMLIAEIPGALIHEALGENQQWTDEYSALVIRNTFGNGAVTYEGAWEHSPQVVGIKHQLNGKTLFGWMRIEFDKTTEIVTLMDYAYDSISGNGVRAGTKHE